MRSIYILQDIETVLLQSAIAIPEVFLNYDVAKIELQVDDVDRPTCWDIVFVEDEDSEVVIGEVTLMEDFEASFDIYADNECVLDES
jgi:hypothetical protein